MPHKSTQQCDPAPYPPSVARIPPAWPVTPRVARNPQSGPYPPEWPAGPSNGQLGALGLPHIGTLASQWANVPNGSNVTNVPTELGPLYWLEARPTVSSLNALGLGIASQPGAQLLRPSELSPSELSPSELSPSRFSLSQLSLSLDRPGCVSK